MTFSIFENREEPTSREKFKALTEQMLYVLLCLREEYCGLDMPNRMPAMTNGGVFVGSGTLYNLQEQQFTEAERI